MSGYDFDIVLPPSDSDEEGSLTVGGVEIPLDKVSAVHFRALPGRLRELHLSMVGDGTEIAGELTRLSIGAAKPVCVDCRQGMTKATIQDQHGTWIVAWLCGCEPDPEIIAHSHSAGGGA